MEIIVDMISRISVSDQKTLPRSKRRTTSLGYLIDDLAAVGGRRSGAAPRTHRPLQPHPEDEFSRAFRRRFRSATAGSKRWTPKPGTAA